MKYKDVVYIIMDELKGFSDDFSYTEDHIIFLINSFRAFLLKQRYSDIKKQIPKVNYQEIYLELCPYKYSDSDKATYKQSINKVPSLLNIGNTSVYPKDFYQGIYITHVSRERMRYVGNNKYLQNIIYTSINPDGYLVLTSNSSVFNELTHVYLSGIFDNAEEAIKMHENYTMQDILNEELPLEEALIPPLVELIVKELTAAEYKPEDNANNSADDLSKVATK